MDVFLTVSLSTLKSSYRQYFNRNIVEEKGTGPVCYRPYKFVAINIKTINKHTMFVLNSSIIFLEFLKRRLDTCDAFLEHSFFASISFPI